MDVSDIISGQRVVSRRRLIEGLLVGVGGATAISTGGYQVVSSAKDEQKEDGETTAGSGSPKREARPDPDGKTAKNRSVVSHIDLTERDGRVTIRLGAYERVVADFNRNGEAVGQSAWRVDGSVASRSGVSLRANEDTTVQLTLQNPTPIPYTFSIHSGGQKGHVEADSYGVTVYAGGVEQLELPRLTQGEYSYLFETPTRPIEALAGRLLIDSAPTADAENSTDSQPRVRSTPTYFTRQSNIQI